jgi:hypothetical protein
VLGAKFLRKKNDQMANFRKSGHAASKQKGLILTANPNHRGKKEKPSQTRNQSYDNDTYLTATPEL